MAAEYSVDVCRALEQRFHEARLARPFRRKRYEPGDTVVYDVDPVAAREAGAARPAEAEAGREAAAKGRVHLHIERFVGGGFAGQVYRVRVRQIEGGPIPGVREDGLYALKVLIPPSSFSLFFRNLVYAIGFQGPFQLQCNPAAARAGALWQKLIRRGARVRMGSEDAVNDVHATLVDENLGSCGELSDWIDGRTWRLEVDDRMDLLRRWRRGRPVDSRQLGSPEFRTKKQFMHDFVKLLHDMGGHEFARQYEWTTWKSQPNCLKRADTEEDPSGGLVAVDFRAGLALLPFLPMSPGDFKLILAGIARGSLVQFDRGDLRKLEAFVDAHADDFADLRESLEELKSAERRYRDSVPDVTHNHVRLLGSRTLWSTLLDSAVTGWSVRRMIDERHEKKLRGRALSTILFSLLGLVPILGKLIRRLWAHGEWRVHYGRIVSSFGYLRRALRGKAAEYVIDWHRDGRLTAAAAPKVASSSGRMVLHIPLSLLPVGLHRFLTDGAYLRERLHYIFVRPVRLYFDAELRANWLRDMVQEGREKRIIDEEDSETILSAIEEPFIQKYLKSLAVHVCTVPVTQVVSVLVAVFYVLSHPEMPRAQAWGIGLGIIALFQVIPISPGSLVRGLYVVWLVIRERNFRDYNIAVFLGFFKYVGYLAFPIQMTYRYPTLARFMAAHWATEAVHVVPVFGEAGALLEHMAFSAFYNWPLTIRRRMRLRAEARRLRRPRYWHVPIVAAGAAIILGTVEWFHRGGHGRLPELSDLAWALALLPLLLGAVVTIGGGGATLWKRIVSSVLGGVGGGVLSTVLTALLAPEGALSADGFAVTCVWHMFIFTVLSPIGAVLTELLLPEPAEDPRGIQGSGVKEPETA
jgi:hypothetical protein